MEVMASQMSAILLGHSGENGAVRVAFDLTAFQKAFPGGQPLLLVRRYADTTAYPAPLTVEEQTAYWTVGAADTARAGYGQCELQWYLEDGTLAKSDLFDFLVLGTLKTDAAPPDAPSRRWFEAIRRQLGDLSKLTTQAKENLVAAINEAAKTGAGSAGSAALRVSEGYIQFRNGDEWENLIAKSELEGTKGEPGEDGETPTIGENGNWYIGPEDTGKPSRGAPGAAASDAQVSSAVDTWLTEHPEATTTVQDGSVSVEKLGYGKHVYGSKPYFCNSVGSGAASFGSIGVVVPCKAGDTIYCTFNMSTSGAYQKPQLLAALPENQYGAIAPIGTIEKMIRQRRIPCRNPQQRQRRCIYRKILLESRQQTMGRSRTRLRGSTTPWGRTENGAHRTCRLQSWMHGIRRHRQSFSTLTSAVISSCMPRCIRLFRSSSGRRSPFSVIA